MEKTSRFNYIKKGIVGVCAATMLTGLCAGAAFADVQSAGTAESVDSGTGKIATNVSVQSEVANISATVPTSVTVSIAPSGALTFPASTDFKIHVNADCWPLKVSELAVATETGFTLAETDTLTEANNLYLTLNGTALKAAAADNATAVASLAQTESKAEDLNIDMAGKVKGVGYTTAPAKIVTLNWTLAPVTE